MRLLVTGGAGFIGSNFIRYWLNQRPEDEVINLDALTYAGNPENLREVEKSPRYFFIKGDISDPAALKRALRGVDGIVHFAAETHVDRSILEPAVFMRTNVIGTQMLLDAAGEAGVKKFIHISTDEVFGSLELQEKRKFSETSPYNPSSPYAASKAAADFLVRTYHKTYGFPVIITNCGNNYGPYQFPEKFIPLMIVNALRGEKLPVYGDGRNIRDWIYVEDHVRALELVIERGKIGETYCIGAGEEKSNLEVARVILNILRKNEDLIEYVKDRPGHDLRYALDSFKIRKELGWRPLYRFADGLRQTIEWYVKNENWWRGVLTKEYLDYYKRQYQNR